MPRKKIRGTAYIIKKLGTRIANKKGLKGWKGKVNPTKIYDKVNNIITKAKWCR
jgi:hypothetical protein